jgi:hypothetical protein
LCYTILRDCSQEARKQADAFRTFYEVRPTLEDQYDLNFTVEILNGRAPIAQAQVIDCIGTFRILPKGSMFVRRAPFIRVSDIVIQKSKYRESRSASLLIRLVVNARAKSDNGLRTVAMSRLTSGVVKTGERTTATHYVC